MRRYCGVVCAALVGRVDVLGEDRALGDARLDDDDADAERRQLLGQALAESFERPLRRDVGRLGERGDAAGDGGDVDDRAPRGVRACRAAPAAGSELRRTG